MVTEWLKDVILHRQGSEHCFGTSPNTSSQERALAVPESISTYSVRDLFLPFLFRLVDGIGRQIAALKQNASKEQPFFLG